MLAAVGMVLAGALLASVVRHAGQAVYDLPAWAVALGVAGGAAALAGFAVLVVRGGWLGLAVAAVGALIVATIVVVPVIAMVLLVGGVVWMASHEQARSDRVGPAAGLVLALALPILTLVAIDGPVVECRADGGVRTSGSVFRGGGSSSGSGSAGGWSAFAPEQTGHFTAGGRSYTYRCAGGRLVSFTAR